MSDKDVSFIVDAASQIHTFDDFLRSKIVRREDGIYS